MPAEANMVDVSFLSLMVPHHKQAVEMSSIVLAAEGISEHTRDLAQRIADQQQVEIEYMDGLATDWNQEEIMRSHAEHLSMGMVSRDQMDQLRNSTGPVMEEVFLRLMYIHHEGAIGGMDNLMKNGGYIPLRDLVKNMKSCQLEEMDEMVEMLGYDPV